MHQRDITDVEIMNQSIYSTNSWSVLFPERPVSPYHLLIIPNRNDVHQFTGLTADELSDMKDVVSFIIETIERGGTSLNGYNLFSNNGTYEIGQHLSRFHQHIFIRIQDELESPYVVMADGRRWTELDSDEWTEQRNKLRLLFNS